MSAQSDIIITGIPRSGTTLACRLLNRLPNVVALNEPMSQIDWVSASGQTKGELVDVFFKKSRQSLLLNKTAISKSNFGQIPDNSKNSPSLLLAVLRRIGINRIELEKLHLGDVGLRQSVVEQGQISFNKALSADFTLCIKHNGQFTGMLPSLADRYNISAVIRNPLAVLCSWNTIKFGPRDGRMYAAEKINPELADCLASHGDRYQRQLALLSWFYERYAECLKADQIIRYEDLVSSNGRVLASCVKQAATLDEPLSSSNLSYHDRKLSAMLASMLLESEGAFWQFYSHQSVVELAEKLT